MKKTVAIGIQSFETVIKENRFYIDKTAFIKEWWDSGDIVTLITRPRRFGKTLNMSMLECFFSVKYKGCGDLFEGLSISGDKELMAIQGSRPVIFLSFADVKQNNYKDAIQKIKRIIADTFVQYRYIAQGDSFTETEKNRIINLDFSMSDEEAQSAIKDLSGYLYRYYGQKVLILLDEYDTPMQEAYTSNYWNEIASFFRNLFNATFKTNPYLERAVMTGITRVSKESMFSDLNNLNVVTTTSDEYAASFGFTEEEVFNSLDEIGMPEEKDGVKEWYDGFCFGSHRDIYNPWSIINFLDKKEYCTYWADTSSNTLLSTLLISAGAEQKIELERLMQGECLKKKIDEQIIFSQLDRDADAVWSLMLAAGYLTIDSVETDKRTRKKICALRITNFETLIMFESMVHDWFGRTLGSYNSFIKALLRNDLEEMNIYMNKVSLSTFSYFDTGGTESEPEKFYHGFVLGLISDLRDRYAIHSNRESGYGRYDVMLEPLNDKDHAFVFEFKVRNIKNEPDLEETVRRAKAQIEEKHYAEELEKKGISRHRIISYGFAFDGKTVLIG